MLAEFVILRSSGLKDLNTALDKVYETNEYNRLVFEAFTRGKKPPQRFSDLELKQIKEIADKIEEREAKKRAEEKARMDK